MVSSVKRDRYDEKVQHDVQRLSLENALRSWLLLDQARYATVLELLEAFASELVLSDAAAYPGFVFQPTIRFSELFSMYAEKFGGYGIPIHFERLFCELMFCLPRKNGLPGSQRVLAIINNFANTQKKNKIDN